MVYVNLISFVEFGHVEAYNIFSGENGNLTYCIDKNKAPRIAAGFSNFNKDCNNICFSESRKIIVEKKKCIDKCINDDIYIYEYNDICYKFEQNTINTDNDNSDSKIIKDINSENLENYISDSIESSETNKNTDYIIKSEFDEKTEYDIITQYIEITDGNKSIDKIEDKENTDKIYSNENIDKKENKDNSDKIENDDITEKTDYIDNI